MWVRRGRDSGGGRGGVVGGYGRDMLVEEPVHQCGAAVSYGLRGEKAYRYGRGGSDACSNEIGISAAVTGGLSR